MNLRTQHQWRGGILDFAIRWARESLLVSAAAACLLLNACTGQSPQSSGPCNWHGEAPPPITRFILAVTAPAVADGVVYVGYTARFDEYTYSRSIAAFRASDGVLLWRRPDPNAMGSTYLVVDHNMLVLTSTNSLAAIRVSDGGLLWKIQRGADKSQPVLDSGVLYALSESELYAIRIADGQLLWHVRPPQGTPTPDLSYPRLFGPIVSGRIIYAGVLNGPVVAVRAANGALLWQKYVVPPVQFTDAPLQPLPTQSRPVAAVGGMLYVAVIGQGLLRMRASDGAIEGLVKNSQGTPVGDADLVIVHSMLYLGVTHETPGISDMTYTLMSGDGKRRFWQVPIAVGPGRLLTQDADILFLFGGDTIAVRLSDGTVLWRQLFTRGYFVAAGQLYASQEGVFDRCGENHAPEMSALDEDTGHVSWVRKLDTVT